VSIRVIEALGVLGKQVCDPVTAIAGTVVSVSFDLDGSIGALVTPKAGADNKYPERNWIPIERLDIGGRVVSPPEFEM